MEGEEGGVNFVEWPEITKFSTMLETVTTSASFNDPLSQQILAKSDDTGVEYRGKIKLHGTNSGVVLVGNSVIAQSRTRALIGCDNEGFATFVAKETGTYFQNVIKVRDALNVTRFVVYGEWCGRGIMRGAAICQVPLRYFCIFAILLDDTLIVAPDAIEDLVIHFKPLGDGAAVASSSVPDRIKVLPWQTDSFVLHFNDSADLEKQIESMNALVKAIDEEDPWVKQHFNISGAGEGLVWYPIGMGSEGRLSSAAYKALTFKAKGEKHLVVKQKAPIQAKVEVPAGIPEFVEMFVTEGRLEQGVENVCGEGGVDKKKVGQFIAWMTKDVEKESKAELARSGLTWNQVKAPVTEKSRKWFLAKAT